MNVKKTFYTYTQNIVEHYGFDSIFDESDILLCSVVKRDENGEIIGNYFRFVMHFSEETQKGQVVFLQGEKEIDNLSFGFENPEELPLVFIAIDHYAKKMKEEEEEDLFLGK